MDKPKIRIRNVFIGAIITTALIVAYAKRDSIQAMLNSQTTSAEINEQDDHDHTDHDDHTAGAVQVLELSTQARKNLS